MSVHAGQPAHPSKAAAAAAIYADAGAEPRLPSGKDINGKPFPTLHYAYVPGVPVVAGVAPRDVVQGRVGDCYFLSSLAALAAVRPDLVAGALKDPLDGTFTVTLHGPGGKPVAVRVDHLFPETGAGALPCGRGLDPRELWPAIFEKAYAKLEGGYSVLNQGGYASHALAALTGSRAHEHALSALSDAKAWKLVVDALAAHAPVVTGTPDARALRARTGKPDMAGLIDDHAYALIGARERGGVRTLILYTPLSPADCGYSKTEPRTIEVPFDLWKSAFDDLTVGTP